MHRESSQAFKKSEGRILSHIATNWAFKQRGLKPATKIILYALADRHNPDYGCFPKQKILAYDCEMSQSTVNLHLNKLEELGLIERKQIIDPDTKKQRPTRYILGFELTIKAVSENKTRIPHIDNDPLDVVFPCPNFDKTRVLISDSNNPVKEPISKKRDNKLSPKKDDANPESLVIVRSKPNRDSRLSKDWRLPKEDYQFAVDQNLEEAGIVLEADKFRDYWISKSGKDATKLDWSATWRNWIRNTNNNQFHSKNFQNGGNHEPINSTSRLHDVISSAAAGTSQEGWG